MSDPSAMRIEEIERTLRVVIKPLGHKFIQAIEESGCSPGEAMTALLYTLASAYGVTDTDTQDTMRTLLLTLLDDAEGFAKHIDSVTRNN